MPKNKFNIGDDVLDYNGTRWTIVDDADAVGPRIYEAENESGGSAAFEEADLRKAPPSPFEEEDDVPAPTGKPFCVVKLTGTDGNAFAIIGEVRKALYKAGFKNEAVTWCNEAFACASYDDLLTLAMGYVTVV